MKLPISNSLFRLILLITILAGSLQIVRANEIRSPLQQAELILEKMSPEERIGQLFLVTFKGSDTGAESQITDLLKNHHIGGVILLADNDNFFGADPALINSAQQALELTRALQEVAWTSTIPAPMTPTGVVTTTPTAPKQYIPLFIGLSQEGDGHPYDHIYQGLTSLPNLMALGATWNTDLVTQVGSILGKELSAIGINLLLGPSLDVLETVQLGWGSTLGTRTFGGDPYWVAEMGRAYIRGLHVGSENRIAIVPKHFPGHGSSDRLPEEEVATVRKSLEQLMNFELAPFFAVTGNAQNPEETADALLTSHIRYQGLQGNIRATTRPVSFDPQALALLMELPALDTWRQNGGLLISDNLGNQAVRRFYDLTSQTFDARRVALNAFLAGNDLLYVADFSSADEPDSYKATLRTLDFFIQKYREDSAFAQRVDASVLRILTLKLRLYNDFSLDSVLADADGLTGLGISGQVTFEVARQAATLISPTLKELDDTIPDPPNQDDRIVFISDARSEKVCDNCPLTPLMNVNALQEAVVRLYGPSSGGQITPNRLVSYSLNDLDALLNRVAATINLERDLVQANWIIFNMLTQSLDVPSFNTLNRFLTERPDLFLNKRVIVFAFCAPYNMDATNISKLTAYYGLYSKGPQFIDVAAYLLFRELRPEGASPVSIPSIGYDLIEALFPDPERGILLEVDLPAPATPIINQTTPEPTTALELRLGDVLPLRTGVILDYNGNPVPDGTPVTFVFIQGSGSIRQTEYTRKGVARSSFSTSISGILEVYAESENARSVSLRFDIATPSGELPTITPTDIPTQTPEPTSTPTNIPTEIFTPPPVDEPEKPDISTWLVSVIASLLVSWVVFRLSGLFGQVRWGVRGGFMVFIGGMLGYSIWMIRLATVAADGMSTSLQPGLLSALLVTGSGIGAGLLGTLFWFSLARIRHRQNGKEKT